MPITHLLLGTNQGNRKALLNEALVLIEENIGAITKQSSIYETASWGNEDLPAHLNVAIVVNTEFSPSDLLQQIHLIEQKLGRERQEKWGLRTMDIDIIFYEDQVINTDDLIVPHPLMQERRFVLEPLNEIAADYIHPIFKLKVADLLEQCKDPLNVAIFTQK